MKNLYKFITSFYLLAFLALSMNAQETRIIRVEGWDPASGTNVDDYNNVLFDAVMADTTERKTNPNVIFELVRGHSYPQGKILKTYDFHLHIRAEEGDGFLPMLVPGKNTAGAYGSDYIYAYNDLTLENLYINCFTPDGKVLNRSIELNGLKMRAVIDGCFIDGDRGGAIAVLGDSTKLYITNVRAGNLGHRITVGGNGRIMDLRPTALYVDTLVMQNCTNYNSSDRIIRNMGTLVNYLLYDHNTAINNVGFHGALQLGKVRTAIVTNNVFANSISIGHVDSRTAEQTQPEKHFSVISMDTTSAIPNPVVVIRNNNIYTDAALTDVWAKYDSVSAPWEITPTLETAIGAGNVAKAWFAEPLNFVTFCGPISEYVDAYFTNPAATSFPENWCVGGQGGYFADELDASYGTTAVSYTAADMMYPVGDLNYYPELKSQWLEGIDLTPKATNAFLSDLKVDGASITGFVQSTTSYNVELANGTTQVPAVSYTLADDKASANIANAAALPGSTKVTVTAEDGTTVLEYMINFTVAVGIRDNSVKLSGNYPNPFTVSTEITYSIGKPARVELTVFDLTGRKLNVLVNQHQPAGYYSVTWNGDNASGKSLPKGMYFYRLSTAEGDVTRSMLKQ